MENWAEISRRVLVDGRSKRSVCRDFDIHWDTLQKILHHPEPPGYRRAAPRPKPSLDPFLPIIHQILEADRKAPRKQRHTARRSFERLRDEHGYTGGLTTVKEAVASWRLRSAEVFIPLAHPPGEAQVDFGEAEIQLDGKPAKVALFLSRTAVAKVLGGRDRKVADAFLRIKSHHLFESHFCLVRRPNEKGHVETLVGFARRRFLVPVPIVHGGLASLNADIERRCREDLTRRTWGKPTAKAERLEGERVAFLPPPSEAFLAARVEPRRVDSVSLVSLDANRYSVPTEFAHHPAMVLASVDDVRVVVGDRVAAVHRRCWGRERVTYDPVHYLAVLERKPGALDLESVP